jgi:hypothetical protein
VTLIELVQSLIIMVILLHQTRMKEIICHSNGNKSFGEFGKVPYIK